MPGPAQENSKTKIILLSVFLLLSAAVILTIVKAKKGLEEIIVPNRPSAKAKDLTIADHFKHQTPINLLLLGYAGANHDGAYLTDSIMVLHLDLKQNKSFLISLPRDIWLKLPLNASGDSYSKINAAYEFGLDDKNFPHKPELFKGEAGGGALAKFAVEKITGLTLDRFVAVDFAGFAKAIDLLGGLDVKVEKSFEDAEYPIDGKETDLCGHPVEDLPELEKTATLSSVVAFPCRFETLRFAAGINHLDGSLALKFVRSRHSSQNGSDFARSNRQRTLLLAVKEKVVSLNFIPKAWPALEILKDHFRTDLSLDDLKTLAVHSPELIQFSVKSLALTTENVLSSTFSADHQYILRPTGETPDDWSAVHDWLRQRVDERSFITTPVIKVESLSRRAGLAELAVKRLRGLGLMANVDLRVARRSSAKTEIELYNQRVDVKILKEIEAEFAVPEVKFLENQEQPYDLLVRLGQDYSDSQPKIP